MTHAQRRSTPDPSKDGGDGIVELAVDEIVVGPLIRAAGVRAEHVDALSELDGRWPPIVVTADDHVVVDGVHRLEAARKLGMRRVSCMLFRGEGGDAFAEAVRLNVRQGLPLSFDDRERAAREVLHAHPQWSDRRIAELCGLAHGTVARLRSVCASGDAVHLDTREGRDGRARPVDPAAVRSAIRDAIVEHPDASLRAIARLVGSTPSTVRSVRARMTDGSERVLSELPTAAYRREAIAHDDERTGELLAFSGVAARVLSDDSALNNTPERRAFVDWFERTAIEDDWSAFVGGPPLSRVYELSDEARRRADRWRAFADALERRAQVKRVARA
jgi:ParB-like chromosome segregation protein Spo0J